MVMMSRNSLRVTTVTVCDKLHQQCVVAFSYPVTGKLNCMARSHNVHSVDYSGMHDDTMSHLPMNIPGDQKSYRHE